MSNQNPNEGSCARHERNGFLGILVGFTAGVVVGGITALLYAPRSGSETREQVRNTVADATEKASELLERSKEIYEETRDKALHTYESAVQRAQSAVEEARSKMAAGHDETGDEEAAEGA